ncbi:AAA family ATPase [Duganella callida]|uniref:ATP-binding protein n=1 Tax=Duganella callida TaxID=2561932 RepID=A0A4Y9SY92_9BURK|nr:AAA family ATPase [Duganella callida]TFW31402.1 ATP-binding protein [Duganella callida]
MKICFIWVARYRNLENFSLNLCSAARFEYSNASNTLDKLPSRALPGNFFGESVADVAGIFGKNGSGKSNALEMICHVLKGGPDVLNADFLIVVREDDDSYVCHYAFGDSRAAPRLALAAAEVSVRKYVSALEPLSVVYFSNVFDQRAPNFPQGVDDISVNNQYQRPLHLRRRAIASDFKRQIDLLNSTHLTTFALALPLQIRISSNCWNRDWLINRAHARRDYLQMALDVDVHLRRQLMVSANSAGFILQFIWAFFLGIYLDQLQINDRNNEVNRVFMDDANAVLAGLPLVDSPVEQGEMMLRCLEKNIRGDAPTIVEAANRFRADATVRDIDMRIGFIRRLQGYLAGLDLVCELDGRHNYARHEFLLRYQTDTERALVADFAQTFADDDVFALDWVGISSGYKAYLTLFSSLYGHGLKQGRAHRLICIDEGDLYLHPEWQKGFLQKLLTDLPALLPGTMQLVLTSHSPFLLSDLPNQCVTLLNAEQPALHGMQLEEKTFAGNLYELYTLGFFLKQSKVSDFAYNKVAQAIDWLEPGSGARPTEFTPEQRELIMFLSEFVGDRMIQKMIERKAPN